MVYLQLLYSLFTGFLSGQTLILNPSAVEYFTIKQCATFDWIHLANRIVILMATLADLFFQIFNRIKSNEIQTANLREEKKNRI